MRHLEGTIRLPSPYLSSNVTRIRHLFTNGRRPEVSPRTNVRLFQRDSHSLTIVLKPSGFSMLQMCAPGSTSSLATPATSPSSPA